MNRRIEFDETPCSHKDYCCKFSNGDEPENKFLKSHLNMALVEFFVDPDNHGVIDKVKEEKIEKHSLANFSCRIFDSFTGGCISNDCVGPNPRE